MFLLCLRGRLSSSDAGLSHDRSLLLSTSYTGATQLEYSLEVTVLLLERALSDLR